MFAKIKSWASKFFTRAVLIPAPANQFEEPSGAGPELPSAESKGRVKLAVIVGHEKKAQGAVMAQPFNKSEYEFNTMVAKAMHKYASTLNSEVEVEIIFRDGLGISGAYARARQLLCDAVIELHFNAFNGKVVGTETLTTPDSSDMDFAHIVQKKMCEVFGRDGQSRGVKAISKSARGGGNVHSFPGGVNCLVEPFFGDTHSEASLAMNRLDEYAEALVQAVVLWGRQVDLLH